MLDVAFGEVHGYLNNGLRRPEPDSDTQYLALNLSKQERRANVGIRAKRKKSGWGLVYLMKVLSLRNKAIALEAQGGDRLPPQRV